MEFQSTNPKHDPMEQSRTVSQVGQMDGNGSVTLAEAVVAAGEEGRAAVRREVDSKYIHKM